MVKMIVAVLGGGLVGTAVGFALGIFVYPYIFLADIVAAEEVPGIESRQVVATGSFIHADPADPIHYGRGRLTLYGDLLHLQSDFEVGPGPKFHVYLVPDEQVTPESNIEASAFVDLGRLKAFKGSQNYPIPPDVALTDYRSVVIWCEQFGVLISPAVLEFGT